MDGTTRAVTVLGQVISLLDAGASYRGSGLVVLISAGVPRWAVDGDSLKEFDLGSLGLVQAATFEVLDESSATVVTGDGVAILWFDRKAGTVSALDRAAVLGGAPSGASVISLYTTIGVVAIADGLPRSFIDLGTGKVTGLGLSLPAGATARSHQVNGSAVVTVDGSPRFPPV
jgi:hypothetical protein